MKNATNAKKFLALIVLLFCTESSVVLGFSDGEDFKVLTTEGFSLVTPYARLLSVWNATVMTSHDDINPKFDTIGSAVLTYKKNVGAWTYLGYTTAGHVIRDLENASPRDKEKAKRSLKLFPNRKNAERIPGVVQDIFKDMTLDLGFFVIKLSSAQASYFSTAHFSKDCETEVGDVLIQIGFPIISTRPPKHRTVPISSPSLIGKRWSQGEFLSYQTTLSTQSDGAEPLSTSTVDSLEGMSGGPVANLYGDLVGIHVGGKGGPYGANDGPTDKTFHSIFVPCDRVKTVSRKFWNSFLSNLGVEI